MQESFFNGIPSWSGQGLVVGDEDVVVQEKFHCKEIC